MNVRLRFPGASSEHAIDLARSIRGRRDQVCVTPIGRTLARALVPALDALLRSGPVADEGRSWTP